MEPIAIAFAALGAIIAIVGGIMLLVAAFRTSVWWGVAYLFVPFAALVFVIMHWEDSRRGFLLNLFGVFIAVGAIFSSPQIRDGIKTMPTAMKLPLVEKEKPGDLNVEIDLKRAEVEQLDAQFRQQGAVVAQQYAALEARRKALKSDDAAGVAAFNAEADAYRQANEAQKKLKRQIDAAQEELTSLLDERSRRNATAGKPGANNTIRLDRAAPAAGARKAAGPVVIFTTSRCPWCTTAKEYFARKGVSYEEKNIDRSSSARAEFERLGGRGVPLILVGSERMEGFSEDRLDELL